MTTRSDQPGHLVRQLIHFPNHNRAQAIFLPLNVHPRFALPHLAIPSPEAVFIIAGGASLLDSSLYPTLPALFTDGIARLAATLNALIIDGGTRSGVMALIGSGMAAQLNPPHAGRNSTLLGIVPAGNVTYPGHHSPPDRADLADLDPNHSHFVLVDTSTWGGETTTMYALAHLLTRGCPSVAIAINGGSVTQTEILYNVRQRRPVVVLSGSGRVADTIAQLWLSRPTSIPDPALAEIIRAGDIHLFPSTGPAADLIQLLQHLLSL